LKDRRTEGKKERRKEGKKERRKEGKKERRKEGKKERRKEGKKEGRKIGGSCQKSAASGGNHLPYLLSNSQGFLMSTFYSPLSRTNVQNSSPFQVMNKCSLFQNNATFLVSPYWVQSSASLRIEPECDQDH
jgi:hypothetical protein